VSSGEKTFAVTAAQPEWLAGVPRDRRLPPGRPFQLQIVVDPIRRAGQRWALAGEAYA
jgi:hypothetical protein